MGKRNYGPAPKQALGAVAEYLQQQIRWGLDRCETAGTVRLPEQHVSEVASLDGLADGLTINHIGDLVVVKVWPKDLRLRRPRKTTPHLCLSGEFGWEVQP